VSEPSEASEIGAVYDYWIGAEPTTPAELAAKGKQWFSGGPAVDDEIRTRFGALVERARAKTLDHWHDTPRGTLAWIVLVDQFSRNMYRNSPEAFAADPMALRTVRAAFESNWFAKLSTVELMFMTLPFEHAEDLDAQREGCVLITQCALAAPPLFRDVAKGWVEYARKHLDVIARFGRFPHRNAVLGRESEPDEVEYLAFCKLAGTWL
jgi:uncharacterized protein (DUF924 family)